MNQKFAKLSNTQKLAWFQIFLIIGQTVLGLLALFHAAQPEPGVEAPSVNLLNQIVALLLIAFGIPAFLVLVSAIQLTKSVDKLSEADFKLALKLQKKGFCNLCSGNPPISRIGAQWLLGVPRRLHFWNSFLDSDS